MLWLRPATYWEMKFLCTSILAWRWNSALAARILG